MDLHPNVEKDLAEILPQLREAGLEPASCRYDAAAFGNYVVGFSSSAGVLEIILDRGQYILGGDQSTLQRLGYWRALETKQEVAAGLQAYLASAA